MDSRNRDALRPHRIDRAAPRAELASSSDAAAPIVQAARLLERAATLTPAEWHDVAQRAHALDAAAHPAAVRRLWHALIGHPQSRALDALNRAACAAASGSSVAAPGFDADQACARAGRITAHAALALALAHELPPGDVALLSAPFHAARGDAGDCGGGRRSHG